MKKSLLALAVLGAFAGAASAQTNVTLYGIVDVGVQSLNSDSAVGINPTTGATTTTGKRTTRMISGGQSASRIGFRGTEDLGSGLKANFVLEQGFNADAGTDATVGSQFGRLAYVGLQGGFGSVILGKQTTPLKDAYDAIDPFGAAGATGNIENIFFAGFTGGATTATTTNVNNAALGVEVGAEDVAIANALNAGRPANTIKYISPSFGGFSAKASYTFGEQTGATSRNRQAGLGLGYANGPLNVQFGYNDFETSAVAAVGTGGTGVPAGLATENRLAFIGTSYDLGVAKLHAAYGQYKNEAVTAAGATTGELKGRNGLLGVTVPFGASSIIASYSVNKIRDEDDADSQRLALMYTYDMSKRTNFYVGASLTKNDEDAALGGATVLGADPRQFNVGVRHRF